MNKRANRVERCMYICLYVHSALLLIYCVCVYIKRCGGIDLEVQVHHAGLVEEVDALQRLSDQPCDLALWEQLITVTVVKDLTPCRTVKHGSQYCQCLMLNIINCCILTSIKPRWFWL